MVSKPPKHLSTDGRKLFSVLQRDYQIYDPAGIKILTTLCEHPTERGHAEKS